MGADSPGNADLQAAMPTLATEAEPTESTFLENTCKRRDCNTKIRMMTTDHHPAQLGCSPPVQQGQSSHIMEYVTRFSVQLRVL